MRLLSKSMDLSDRYPWIVQGPAKIRQKQSILDGEAVVLGVDGISDFNALHSRQHDEEVRLHASASMSRPSHRSLFTQRSHAQPDFST